jgi:Mlc titration factor MtfA (ptsG expression regulator)
MILSWLRRRRRRRLLAPPFPATWWNILEKGVSQYSRLSAAEQSKLRGDLRILVAEKHWEGCGGLKLDDTVKVTIAAQAALLLLGFEEEYFRHVKTILVYPGAYVAPSRTVAGGGVVIEGHSSREGEAWYRGPVILSWADARSAAGKKNSRHNVVLHEFAHQLDMENGDSVDGTPRVGSRDQYRRWEKVMQLAYDRLVRRCRHGLPTLLDCYGATNRGEFFAVATECFFGQPAAMKNRHPRLYRILREFYRQDPAVRL